MSGRTISQLCATLAHKKGGSKPIKQALAIVKSQAQALGDNKKCSQGAAAFALLLRRLHSEQRKPLHATADVTHSH